MNSKATRKSTENPEIFKRRRQKVMAGLHNAALLVAAHPEYIRNDDVHYAYRQDSNMYYLTGFEEPEAFLLLRPGKSPETVMFVRQKNVERETWDGFRFGPAGTKKEFLIDEKQIFMRITDWISIMFNMFDKNIKKEINKIL